MAIDVIHQHPVFADPGALAKRAARRAAILIAALLYALALGEAYVRVAAPQAFVPRLVSAAPYGVRMNTPGAIYEHRTPETRATVTINSQGLRAPLDFPESKPAGVGRVAVFGDSYLLGYEASFEDIAATQIERMLNAAGCRAEVMNFAVSGFGSGEMLRTLEDNALRFSPDVVLFSWHHTDPDDNKRANLYARQEGVLQRTGARYTPAVAARARIEALPGYRLLAAHSHLFTIVREKGSRFARRGLAGKIFSRKTTQSAATMREAPARPIDLALLDGAERRARDAGAGFFVVDVPSVQSRTRFKSSFRLLPDDYAARPHYLSPIEHFNAAAGVERKLYWERGHRHLTPLGNRLLAEATVKGLLADRRTARKLHCR